ncbi:MAG: helix-turn-helix transcriptional regulator, partial [Armatimonadota bacterium]
LLQKLRSCLEKEGFTVCIHPCQAEAAAVVDSPLTPAQVEVLQAYVEAGDVEEVARLRGCSAETVRRHLAEARRRVGAKNVAQLVHIAWALGLLTIGYNKNWSKKWQKFGIDAGGGRCRIWVENSKRRGLPKCVGQWLCYGGQ